MFIDAYLPAKIRGYPFVSSPRWSTSITSVASGSERRNQNWVHPLLRFTAPESISCQEDLELIKDAWYALAGPVDTFPFRDPLDFASRALPSPDTAPATILRTDQYLGTFNPATKTFDRAAGDGVTRAFQLVKEYSFGTKTYRRLIYMPVLSSILVGINGFDPAGADPTPQGGPFTFTVSRTTGEVEFDHAPEAGAVLTWGGLFDVEARFESDESFDAITRTFGVTGAADLSFVEVRPC